MAKTTSSNVRATLGQRVLLTKAAKLLHNDRSTFIVDIACHETENIILEQRLFQLTPDNFAAFEKALTAQNMKFIEQQDAFDCKPFLVA